MHVHLANRLNLHSFCGVKRDATTKAAWRVRAGLSLPRASAMGESLTLEEEALNLCSPQDHLIIFQKQQPIFSPLKLF